MVFSKSFPKRSKTSVYPQWEDVFITEEEEKEAEQKARKENLEIMQECLADAEELSKDKGLERKEITEVAIALFQKRASHQIWWKERKARERFDASN